MFSINAYPENLQQHMRAIATEAMHLADIPVHPDVPVVEQLNDHGHHPYIGDARQAIIATMVTGQAAELVLTPGVEATD